MIRRILGALPPKPPGFIAFAPGQTWGGSEWDPASACPGTESALGSLPSVALSSAQPLKSLQQTPASEILASKQKSRVHLRNPFFLSNQWGPPHYRQPATEAE